ncbi:MAG: Gfo/Idh/MocA family protein [bacterium]
MKKIAVIGAGQIGSRHLQGLAKSNIEILIEVVDPSITARQIALQRFREMPQNDNIKGINIYEKIQDLSDNLDLVIIATNADVRFKVAYDLLKSKHVQYLVLEKVLFQTNDEYYDMLNLLKLTNTKCWVNHARRMFPFYKWLKDRLSKYKKIHLAVSGASWGLACNTLHFIDLIQYLTGEENITIEDLTIDTKYLDKSLYESKRVGFKELGNLLVGKLKDNTFAISCFKEGTSPVLLNITSNDMNILIDESDGWYIIAEKDSRAVIKEEKIVYFQSELTSLLMQDIFSNSCVLPTYEQSFVIHSKFISSLIVHINSFSDFKYNFCPIT